MLLYFGKKFTATRQGHRFEAVTCDQCGTRFQYELTRVGAATASAPYLLFQTWASRRADAGAERDLAKRLARDAELVPCPKCSWINEDLIARYQKRKYSHVLMYIPLPLVAGIVLVVLLLGIKPSRSDEPWARPLLGLLAALCFLSPAFFLLIQRQLRRRFNPNKIYPQRAPLPPGTPPALLEKTNPHTGQLHLSAVAPPPDDQPASLRAGEWALLRPLQLRFPPICCVCLEPATTHYRPPLQVNKQSDLPVPLCRDCLGQLRRRWWITLLAVAALSIILAALLASLPRLDPFGRWFLFGLLAFFGALFGGVVTASQLTRPYRIAHVDADRALLKFSARNPRFTALLIEQTRAQTQSPLKSPP